MLKEGNENETVIGHALFDTINRDTQGALVGAWERTLANIFLPTSHLQLAHRRLCMRGRKRLHQFYSQISTDVQVFSFIETVSPISFTMVTKRYLGGEYAVGHQSASSISKCSTSVTSDLGNGSFGSKSVTLSIRSM